MEDHVRSVITKITLLLLVSSSAIFAQSVVPLPVGYDDALAMQKAAQQGKIKVLVNYETTWYRSNRAAYDLLHQGTLGEVRKVVIHDGHFGPKEIGVQPEFLTWLNDPKLNGGG